MVEELKKQETALKDFTDLIKQVLDSANGRVASISVVVEETDGRARTIRVTERSQTERPGPVIINYERPSKPAGVWSAIAAITILVCGVAWILNGYFELVATRHDPLESGPAIVVGAIVLLVLGACLIWFAKAQGHEPFVRTAALDVCAAVLDYASSVESPAKIAALLAARANLSKLESTAEQDLCNLRLLRQAQKLKESIESGLDPSPSPPQPDTRILEDARCLAQAASAPTTVP